VPLACSAIAISSGPTLSLTNMSDHPHTATITWTASQAGSARVEYSGPEGTGAVGAGSTANHNASFVFSAGGTYTYTIIMANLCGQTYVWSGSFTH
jgi:plastocyanin